MSHRFNIYTDRPSFLSVPLADGLKWNGAGGQWAFQEKTDGCWCLRKIGCSLLAGERMRDGRFYGFDIPVVSGQDISREPLRFRLKVLADFIRTHPEVLPVATGNGGEFLEAVLARGGEGVVAKHLESRYGELDAWVKCKRFETHDCVVTELHPQKQSIRLGGRGWCSSIQFPRLKVGDVVEVGCHSITAKGRFREPRLLRIRTDKAVVKEGAI
jgi:ATP-dependent DNA ligase